MSQDKNSGKNNNQFNFMHWSFTAAQKTMHEHGEQELYTCASGVTPSGVIHIGNFREIITVDLVRRAFKILGKKVRHLHSWDSYDVFRKIPSNMPQPEVLEKHLRMSIVDTPDTTNSATNYAEKNLKDVENILPEVGIFPEYKYQAELYKQCFYAENIKKALENTDKIKAILNEHRKEPLSDIWLPTSIFCDSCKKDTITKQEWKGDYELYYECECGHKEAVDFREKGIVKLLWRVDWPMRWSVEKVHFEPGGKDHSSPGSSYTTGKEIVKQVWDRNAPTYIMYDFISIKGRGGKISSSSGEVVTLKDCLEIYQPEIIRFLFAGTRPNTEFAISFDLDVNKIYEDYDKSERIYYGLETVNDKEKEKNKWIYELSQVDEDNILKESPNQISFKEITQVLCVKDMDEQNTFEYFDSKVKEAYKQRLMTRIACAKNWLEKYADDNFKFKINKEKNQDFFSTLNEKQIRALDKLKEIINQEDEPKIMEEKIFNIPKELGMDMKDFFRICYQAIISRDKGPKLAGFIMEIGKERLNKIL
ncbi:MAG: lysine--tRNA ligase [Candidatus Woesearchaeota archaeon]